jgi:hypothetical protein
MLNYLIGNNTQILIFKEHLQKDFTFKRKRTLTNKFASTSFQIY